MSSRSKIALAALFLSVAVDVAEAGFLRGEDRAQQQTLLRGEWERSRALGGYEDPITAFKNLLNGSATPRTIQPNLRVDGSTTIQDLRQQFAPSVPITRE